MLFNQWMRVMFHSKGMMLMLTTDFSAAMSDFMLVLYTCEHCKIGIFCPISLIRSCFPPQPKLPLLYRAVFKSYAYFTVQLKCYPFTFLNLLNNDFFLEILSEHFLYVRLHAKQTVHLWVKKKKITMWYL